MNVSEKAAAGRISPFLWILLTILILMAAVSVWQGAHNALAPGRSQDFQWSGTHIVVQHIDPWADYLNGDPVHQIVKTQVPNYLPLLYVLIWPIGMMSLSTATAVWAVCNLTFGLISAFLCGRFYGFRGYWCGVLVAMLMASTPMRNSLGNGQQSLLVLLIWVLALCRTPKASSALTAGFSYFKYSFAPPLFLLLLFRIGIAAALLSLVPALVTLVFVYLWTGGSLLHPVGLLHMLFEPLKVAQSGGYFGTPGSNLMDALELGLKGSHLAPAMVSGLEYGLPLVISTVLIYLIARKKSSLSWDLQIALLALVSILLFKHHGYDEVVLLFPVAYCMRNIRTMAARWALGILCYLWYGERLAQAAVSGALKYGFGLDIALLVLAGILISWVPFEGRRQVTA
jgi:hypothetical protein